MARVEFLKDEVGWVNLRPYAVISGPAGARAHAYSIGVEQKRAGGGWWFGRGSRIMVRRLYGCGGFDG